MCVRTRTHTPVIPQATLFHHHYPAPSTGAQTVQLLSDYLANKLTNKWGYKQELETRLTRKRERKGHKADVAWNPAPGDLRDLLAITSHDFCITLCRLQSPSTSLITFDSQRPPPHHLPQRGKGLCADVVEEETKAQKVLLASPRANEAELGTATSKVKAWALVAPALWVWNPWSKSTPFKTLAPSPSNKAGETDSIHPSFLYSAPR